MHSVDRVRLVAALDRAAAGAGRRLDALVQVDLARAERPRWREHRPTSPHVADAIAAGRLASTWLGVMAVAPLGADPDAGVRAAGRGRREPAPDPPAATVVSAGMSDDLEAAVAHGATHLRVGTALLGSRPPLG